MTEDETSESPSVDDKKFMEHVREAIENGYDVACVWCGVGVSPDGLDMHDRPCPLYVPWEPTR